MHFGCRPINPHFTTTSTKAHVHMPVEFGAIMCFPFHIIFKVKGTVRIHGRSPLQNEDFFKCMLLHLHS